MSNYYQLKNRPFLQPTVDVSVGSSDTTVGNIYLTGNIYINNQVAVSSTSVRPGIVSLIYPNYTRAVNANGGETVLIKGSGFRSNAVVRIANTVVAATVANSSYISFTAPATTSGKYMLTVTNADSSTVCYPPGIDFSDFPSWVTPAGNRVTVYETQSVDTVLQFSGPNHPNIVRIDSGMLPTGLSLDPTTGRITGTAPIETQSNVYSITASITDYQNQTTTRNYSLTINPTSITWSTPNAGAQSFTQDRGTAFNLSLSASDQLGSNISYSASNLPSGISLSNNNLSGTLSAAETKTVTLTASSAATQKSSNFNISIISRAPISFSEVTPSRTSLGRRGAAVHYYVSPTNRWRLFFIPEAAGAQVGDLVFLYHMTAAYTGQVESYATGFTPIIGAKALVPTSQRQLAAGFDRRIIQTVSYKVLDSLNYVEVPWPLNWGSGTLTRPEGGHAYLVKIFRPTRPIESVTVHQTNITVRDRDTGLLNAGEEIYQSLNSEGLESKIRFYMATGMRTSRLQLSTPSWDSNETTGRTPSCFYPREYWPGASYRAPETYGHYSVSDPFISDFIDGNQVVFKTLQSGNSNLVQQVRPGSQTVSRTFLLTSAVVYIN